MDEDLETFIKRYKYKIVDQQKPFRREDSTNLNQMAGIEIPPQDIADNLQQKWNVDKLSSFQNTNRANVFSDSRVNNDFLSKLGVYEEKRRRLQALRKEEYNILLAEKQKNSNNRRNLQVEPEKITPQPYEEILEKKRQEEKEYRRITNQFDPVIDDKSVSNVNSDTSIMSSNFTQPSSKDPSKDNMQSDKVSKVVRFEEEHGGTLQIGKELGLDEIQRRKEQYRIELRKQIDEAEALRKKKHNRITKSSPSPVDSSSKFSSPNNNNNNNNNSNNINNNVSNNSSNNVEMNHSPIQAPPTTNPPITSFQPMQSLNFQHLPSFPLLAPTPFYGPSIVPTTVFLQQPGILPTIYSSYYTGTQQLPPALNQFNSDFSAVMNSPLLPHYLRLIENQPGNFTNSPSNQLATFLPGNNSNNNPVHNNNEQQEQSDVRRHQQQHQQAGVLEAFLFGGDEKNEADKKKKYQQDLKNQIEEAKRKKHKQKEEDDNYDRRLQEELERYHTQKDTPKTTNRDFESASEKKSNESIQRLPDEIADINTSDPQNQSNHARGGNGIFGEPMSEEQRKTKSKYQEDLLKQIEDKKRRENEEKERKKREDEIFLRKIEEEKKKMEEEFEEEKKKALQKKKEEDKRREEEAKVREEKMLLEAEKKKQQEQSTEKPSESQMAERVAPRQIQNRQKSPPIPALRSSRQRRLQTPDSASQEGGQVLSLLTRMKTELDLRKIKADKILRKISQEKFQTTAKQPSESLTEGMERLPEDTSGVISSSSNFTIGKADLTTSLESIGSPKVRSKSSATSKAPAASKPAPSETPKIHRKSAKTPSTKLQKKQAKDPPRKNAKNFPEKSKTKEEGSTSASQTSLQSMPLSKKSSSPDLKGYVDYEAELLEDLLKKKKQVDSNLRRALRDLDKLSDEPMSSTEKSNLRNSTVSLFSTENMTDEERLLSATSRSLREKFKEIDQRPFSVNSLEPEELSRQNEERLKRLRVLTDEMISRNHDTFNPLTESSAGHMKTSV